MIPNSLANEHKASVESFGMLAIRIGSDWHNEALNANVEMTMKYTAPTVSSCALQMLKTWACETYVSVTF